MASRTCGACARVRRSRQAQVEANRQAYRDLLFTSPELAKHISGVILFGAEFELRDATPRSPAARTDETIRQNALDGTPFVELLTKQGVIPGIKLDAGPKPLPLCPNEIITEGLDGLPKRAAEYYALGARFAKWRAVITIGEHIPSMTCLKTNANALARYAAICQEAGLVPIVEPEVLMDGAHTIERCEEVTERTLRVVFQELALQKVGSTRAMPN